MRFLFRVLRALRMAWWSFVSEESPSAATYHVIRLKPKAAMLAWVKQYEAQAGEYGIPQKQLTLNYVQREAVAVLMHGSQSDEESKARVRERWKDVWAVDLETWCENPDQWPLPSREEFDRWYELEVINYVVALDSLPVR
jgi:hypothetical protein